VTYSSLDENMTKTNSGDFTVTLRKWVNGSMDAVEEWIRNLQFEAASLFSTRGTSGTGQEKYSRYDRERNEGRLYAGLPKMTSNSRNFRTSSKVKKVPIYNTSL
jgi:hypothetical protein